MGHFYGVLQQLLGVPVRTQLVCMGSFSLIILGILSLIQSNPVHIPPRFRFSCCYSHILLLLCFSIYRGHYVGIHTSNFRDFILKPELLRAVTDCGFEHPSEVQHECIPQALLGMDVICQAKSGMGKTAVFVLATLHQLQPVAGEVHVLVLCHTRELAFQIQREYQRFSKYLPDVKSAVFYGGK